MTEQARTDIREFLQRRFHVDLDDDESIFASGKVDSFDAIQLLLHLESSFGLDTSDPDFDLTQLDTLDEIVGMLARQGKVLEPSL